MNARGEERNVVNRERSLSRNTKRKENDEREEENFFPKVSSSSFLATIISIVT